MPQQSVELVSERLVGSRLEVGRLELGHRSDERLGNEAPSVGTVVASGVRIALAEGR